jgi:hypothetical protein
MRSAHKTTTFGLILCNVLGIHNRRRQSVTGAVHYCSRCGIVTRDNRRHWLKVADITRIENGTKIIFGAGGQEFMGLVEKIDYSANKIALSHIVVLPKWRSKLAKARANIKKFQLLKFLRGH